MSEEESAEETGEGERQEYYLDTIQRIVEEQKETLGEEAAIKWARRAPLKIDSDGEVTGFYGTGEQALETLRDYTEHEEFYLEAIQKVIDTFSEFMGEDVGVALARKAPLQLMPGGEVNAYYGTGRKALEILKESYEDYIGEAVADRKMKNALAELEEQRYELLPEDIRPEPSRERYGQRSSLLEKLKGVFRV